MKLPLRSGASRGVIRDAENRLLVVMEEDRGAAEELVRLVNSAAELERVNRELAAEVARLREGKPPGEAIVSFNEEQVRVAVDVLRLALRNLRQNTGLEWTRLQQLLELFKP